MKRNIICISLLTIVHLAIGQSTEEFGNYWYQGLAEISTYELQQARYGEMREGTAVLIFVTEDFSKKDQVKLDRPEEDGVPVMKLNATRSFHTGVYPYSMMTSSFSPVSSESSYPIKVTCSSQEWCGHTFTQMNDRGDAYQIMQRSYFQSEGDLDCLVDQQYSEDGIWNLIRINPSLLPKGTVQMIPSFIHVRLTHIDLKDYKVEATLEKGESYSVYTLKYPELNRTVSIQFASKFPHTIESWEETYRSGWGANAKELTTTAKRKVTKQIDYWNKNHNSDAYLRQELGLEK